jgi:serine/threonine-protein kinase
MMNRSAVAALAGLVLAVAPPSMASASEFGAIAFSPSTGAHGYAFNHNSRRAAERAAMNGCRGYGGGCRIVVWFSDACAALAVGDGYGYGYSWAESRNQAQNRAIRECNTQTSSCEVVRWVCSK